MPRPYVTGETIDSVVSDLTEMLWPALCSVEFASQEDPVAIPNCDAAGRCINAAACALDIAALRRFFERLDEISPQVLERLVGRVRPRSSIDTPVSGVLGSTDPGRTARMLRAMRWFGLRDFKLKLGLGPEVDRENLQVVHKQIGRAVARGRCTLRVDLNGAWKADETPQRIIELKQYGVCVVEQPVYCSAGELAELARRCELPLMADESLLTERDAAAMLAEPAGLWWNIRLTKNGGLVRSLALARLAAEHRVPFTLGCMVGESSILSAAQRRLLQLGPVPRFLEGNYGRFCMAGDLTTKSLHFGYAGRLKPLKGPGLGVTVDSRKLTAYGSLVAVLRA